MNHFFSIVLSAFMLVGGLSGCGTEKPIEGTTVVATVDGVDITADFYSFYLTQVKKQMNSQGVEDFWDTAELDGKKLIETAREKALDEAINAVIIEKKAAEQKLTISDAEEKEINDSITQAVSQLGGREKYNTWLAEQGLTNDMYRRFMTISYLSQKLFEKQVEEPTDDEVKAYYKDNIARVKHILVLTTDQNNAPLSNDVIAEKRKLAEDYLKRARDGEDFDTMVAELSEDPGSKSQPDGYYLGEGFILGSQGSMVPEFEEASLALKAGEISDIVETSYGFHIIKRYENEDSKYTENLDSLKYYAKYGKFTVLQEEWKKSADVKAKNDIINRL